MWTAWTISTTGALLAAVLFSGLLAALFSWAAYVLPRALDSSLCAHAGRAHRRYRVGFWVLAVALACVCVWRFGATPAALAAIIYIQVLLALAWIDAETGLLPDILSLSLLWLGLLVNLYGAFTALPDAVVGAVAGYLALWIVCQAFFLLTGRVGMGHGDFKLLAAMGAWLGWMSLPWVLLISSLLALVVALCLRLSGRMKAGDALHFGPYLAAAGILMLLRL